MRVIAALACASCMACASRGPIAPPPSQVPDARAAIARMRASGDCGNAIVGEATIDVSGRPPGLGKAQLDVVAARGSRLRFGATAPVVGVLGTLANDGDRFAMHDAREGRYVYGPSCASAGDLPVSPFVLSELLRGQAPVLRNEGTPTIAWNDRGYYVVRIASTRNASEELHLAPAPSDWSLPWSEQRMRVVEVRVWQEGILLYHAELDGHVARATSPKSQKTLDDEAVSAVLGEAPEASLGPNGPSCNAEVPTRIRVRVPAKNDEVVFRWQHATWNPELTESTFRVRVPNGIVPRVARCR